MCLSLQWHICEDLFDRSPFFSMGSSFCPRNILTARLIVFSIRISAIEHEAQPLLFIGRLNFAHKEGLTLELSGRCRKRYQHTAASRSEHASQMPSGVIHCMHLGHTKPLAQADRCDGVRQAENPCIGGSSSPLTEMSIYRPERRSGRHGSSFGRIACLSLNDTHRVEHSSCAFSLVLFF